MILVAACGGLVLLLVSIAVGWFVSRPAKRDDTQAATVPVTDPKPDPNPPPASKPQKPPGDGEKLTAASLLTRFQANREKMAQRYEGATLTVTGTLGSPAERNPNGEVVLELAIRTSGSRCGARLHLKVDTAAAKLPAGAEVTLRGQWPGSGATVGPFNALPVAAEDVVLADCVLIGEPILLRYPRRSRHRKAWTTRKGITHNGIEVKITAAYVGRPVVILGGGGPERRCGH